MTEKVVKVFSTSSCPWCRKAKEFLDKNKIAYQDLNVAEDKVARDEMLKLTNQMAVPTIAINDEFIVGYNENALKSKLGIT